MTQLGEKSLPAIANWKGYHWIVVYEVTDKYVVCSDPADGLVRHSHEDFIAGWSRYTIFMEPTKKFADFLSRWPQLNLSYLSTSHLKTILELFLLALFMQVLLSLPLFPNL